MQTARLLRAPRRARSCSWPVACEYPAMVHSGNLVPQVVIDFADSSPGSAGPFRVGDLIDDTYEITRVLGAGGMGVVYEARDLILLRLVAIKAPLFAAYARSLRAEAQALAAIRNPAFVTVHHVGHHKDVLFMVMERLFGDTLETRLDEARARGEHLSLEEVLDLLIPITDALSAAHAVGIAQRDLKPANVVVCGERVVLVDLGLFVPEVLVAPENDAAGSAEYIAPEVLLRTVEPGEGPLIDLYALGILTFELLTNTTPFGGESLGRMLANHVGAPVPDVRARRPDVPPELAGLVSELLAKDPRSRPPSAEAVLWQLKDVRNHGVRRTKRMSVLAIDDEAHVGIALKKSLEAAFPQVHVYAITDPERAMPSATGTFPAADVVLVDLNMPKHNGIEVCMSFLALPLDRRPVVVAMSAQATERDIAVLHALGVRHFVPKDAAFVSAMSNVIRDLRNGGPPHPHR
jgi:serine/threonine protein kinase